MIRVSRVRCFSGPAMSTLSAWSAWSAVGLVNEGGGHEVISWSGADQELIRATWLDRTDQSNQKIALTKVNSGVPVDQNEQQQFIQKL